VSDNADRGWVADVDGVRAPYRLAPPLIAPRIALELPKVPQSLPYDARRRTFGGRSGMDEDIEQEDIEFEDIEQVFEVASDYSDSCPICREPIGIPGAAPDATVAMRANHLLAEHDCTLLHVGQRTVDHGEGPEQATVYVFGSTELPASDEEPDDSADESDLD
jgi:hypothetical protein